MSLELTPSSAPDHLRHRGIVPPDAAADARSLGGGVSNAVIEVTWDDRCLVCKQPFPNLAVEADWPADVERVHNEAAAARAYRRLLRAAGVEDARVPAVVDEDRETHVVAMDCAPRGATAWKRDLLDGHVDRGVARTVGRALAAVQREAAGDRSLREQFASKRPFEQLRLDPYHAATARAHPDLADRIRAEAERVRGVERTLVHGDYSPKNVLLADGTVWLLDFEVAHWGDPAFDAAFVLNHLLIKSIYNHGRQSAYLAAARALWETYEAGVPWDCEADVAAELGVLLLARIDGKSPVEYVEAGPVADAVRATGRRTLRGEAETVGGVADVARAEVDRRWG